MPEELTRWEPSDKDLRSDPVVAWRCEQLKALGFDDYTAFNLASNRDVDLGHARKLIAGGCSVHQAVEILA